MRPDDRRSQGKACLIPPPRNQQLPEEIPAAVLFVFKSLNGDAFMGQSHTNLIYNLIYQANHLIPSYLQVTLFQLFRYWLERLQFQKISIQLVLSIYVGFINFFDSGLFCHTYNKIFFSYVHSQTENYTAWDPFHHYRRLHNAASDHPPFFIIFMALFFDQSRSFLFP